MIRRNDKYGIFIKLVKSIINEELCVDVDSSLIEEIYELSVNQNLVPIVFCALSKLDSFQKNKKWLQWQKEFLDICLRSEIQNDEISKLSSYLCSHGVKLIPLKGIVIRDLYPIPNFRVMSDLDFFFSGISNGNLRKLMEDYHYKTLKTESEFHDVYVKEPCLNVELHKNLIPDSCKYSKAFKDFFTKSVPDDKIENLFYLRPEELYLHVIAHDANHFNDSGIGIRPLLDIYLIRRKYASTWDYDYIKTFLKSINLENFENKLSFFSDALFSDKTFEVSDDVIDFLFRGGAFGILGDNLYKYSVNCNKGKFSYYIKEIFLPYSIIRDRYSILGKLPILLPIFWVYRWFDVLFTRNWKLKEIASLSNIDNQSLCKIENVLTEFGMR